MYSDNDISFLYPKTFCGTSWQEDWDIYSCKYNWRVERTKDNFSSSEYAGGALDSNGTFIQIMPSYSSFGFEFGGDIQISFLSKTKFNSVIKNKVLQEELSKEGLKIYLGEKQAEAIRNFYITNGTKHIAVYNNFPEKYPIYFPFLINSITLK